MERLPAVLATLARGTVLAPSAALAIAWQMAAGDLAPRGNCSSLSNGVLRIEACDATARAQILSVQAELATGLNRVLGPGAVRRIEISHHVV